MRCLLVAMSTLLLAPVAWVPTVAAQAAPGAVVSSSAPSGARESERAKRCRSGYVSLTFDDGPSAKVTPDLVKILRRAGVPATFFMVGQRVAGAPRAARQVARAGFLIANHSYAHSDMTRQSQDQVVQTLRDTNAVLRSAGTRPTNLMRPPYGAINDNVRQAVRRAGLVPVLWDIDPRDYAGGSSDDIASSILAQLRPGRSNVVLQHDGVGNSPASVAAVPRVVEEARRRGYCFTALDERGLPGFPTPKVSLDLGRSRVPEGQRVRWRLSLDKPTARRTTVAVRLRSRMTGQVLAEVPAAFRAGRLGARGSFDVPRDGVDEAAERWDLELVDPHGLRLTKGKKSATVVVLDRDPAPRLGGVDRTVDEPAEEPRTIEVRFRLDQVSARTIRATVVSRHGTTDDHDFVAVRTPVVLEPGARSVLVEVTLRPDSDDPVADQPDGETPVASEEAEEAFTLELISQHHVRRGPPATITIRPHESEPPPPIDPPTDPPPTGPPTPTGPASPAARRG